MTLTSTVVGSATVTAKGAGADAGKTAAVGFTVGPAADITATASPSTLAADGNSTSTITATVKDAMGNLLSGVTVSWSTTLGTLAGATSVTNAAGIATMGITSSEVDSTNVKVTAQVGTAKGIAPMVFTPLPPTNITVFESPKTIVANGVSTSTLTARVSQGGVPIPNVPVTWEQTAGTGTLSASSSMTDANGQSSVLLTSSTTPGTAYIRVTSVRGTTTAGVEFTAPAPTTLTVTATPTSIVANGSSKSTVGVRVKDADGNLMPGVAVNWATTAGTLAGPTSYTDGAGYADNVLTSSTAAGTATVTATAGAASGSTPITFTPAGFTVDKFSISCSVDGVQGIVLEYKCILQNKTGQPLTIIKSVTRPHHPSAGTADFTNLAWPAGGVVHHSIAQSDAYGGYMYGFDFDFVLSNGQTLTGQADSGQFPTTSRILSIN